MYQQMPPNTPHYVYSGGPQNAQYYPPSAPLQQFMGPPQNWQPHLRYGPRRGHLDTILILIVCTMAAVQFPACPACLPCHRSTTQQCHRLRLTQQWSLPTLFDVSFSQALHSLALNSFTASRVDSGLPHPISCRRHLASRSPSRTPPIDMNVRSATTSLVSLRTIVVLDPTPPLRQPRITAVGPSGQSTIVLATGLLRGRRRTTPVTSVSRQPALHSMAIVRWVLPLHIRVFVGLEGRVTWPGLVVTNMLVRTDSLRFHSLSLTPVAAIIRALRAALNGTTNRQATGSSRLGLMAVITQGPLRLLTAKLRIPRTS